MKKKKTSPLQINQALIENYKGVNKYTRTGGGTRIPEMGVEGVDAMFKPMARTAAVGLTKSYLGSEDKKEKTDADRIKALEAQIAKMQQPDPDPKPKDDNRDPSTDSGTDTSADPSANDVDIDPSLLPSQKEKDAIKKEVEKEFNQYPDDSSPEEKAVEEQKAQRIKVRSKYFKGDPNTVEVNGQKMSIDEFNEKYPSDTLNRVTNQATYRTGPNAGEPLPGGGGMAGDYDYTPSPAKMLDNSPVKQTYDPVQDLQMQNPNIERDVDNYIANMSVVGDEKLDILGAQANSRVFDFSKQLKDQANMYIDQEANSKIVNDSINTLRGLAQKVNNLMEKKSEWIENNGGGESTKRMFSKGSSGKNKFMQNAIFMERDDLYKMILPLPEVTVGGDKKFDDIEFAFGDFNKSDKPNFVIKSSDMFKDVFMKPEGKFAEFRKAANKMGEDSRNRKPFNEYHSEVIVNGLLDSKENTLAFAWDDFAGPSFIEQYKEANPNEDISWADVDSPNFQENKLKDEVSYWLKRKLKSEHDMAKATQEAFAEAGQMTAQQLLKKYSL